MMLPVWMTHILTGRDNETHDIARHSWFWTTLVLIAGGVWNLLHHGTIDLFQWAQAFAVNVAAHGGALWAKAGTEPAAKPVASLSSIASEPVGRVTLDER